MSRLAILSALVLIASWSLLPSPAEADDPPPASSAGVETDEEADHGTDPRDMLPPDNVPAGWSSVGQASLLHSEGLLEHIDGGGQLFLKQGFRALAMQEFSGGSLKARVEIYDMGSSNGAEKVFALNTGDFELSAAFGLRSLVDPLQILFHRDRYYVSVTGFSNVEESARALEDLAATADLLILLPGPGVPDGWDRPDPTRFFLGMSLFDHINGGAEVYHELGFRELAVQNYSRDEMEVAVEVYDMGSPAGAVGIFKRNSEALDTGDWFGQGSAVDPYQIIFHQGRFYASITCFEESQELYKAMTTLAEDMLGRM